MAILEGSKYEEIWNEARERWDQAWNSNFQECNQAMQDRRFVNVDGGMYEGNLEQQYQDRPRPQVNKTRKALRKMVSEFRRNPITADFIAEGVGSTNEIADQLDGAYRADEQDYDGQEAYDACDDEAAAGGKGAYRLRPVSEDEYDEDNDRQRIAFEWIPDADVSVQFDTNSKKLNKSDAQWMGVIHAMTPQAYREEYDDDPDSWPEMYMFTDSFDWYTPDFVYVLEYYRCEEKTHKVFTFETFDGEEIRYTEKDMLNQPDLKNRLEATGHTLLRTKRVKRKEVRKYILSGGGVLEDDGRVPGNIIPIVIQYGERSIVNGVERFNGVVRLLKDIQRIYNMLIGMLAEAASIGINEVPIFDPLQMDQAMINQWNEQHIKRRPMLFAKALEDVNGNIVQAGPVAYTKPADVPPSLAALIQVVGSDINELLGESQNPQEIVSNISGKAVELIEQKREAPNYIYISNRKAARQRGVEIWEAMAEDLYVEHGRKMRTVNRDNKESEVVIGRPFVDSKGAVDFEFNMADKKIRIVADVGPSSSSKKAATARELLTAAQVVPQGSEQQMVLLSGAMMNMEGEGLGDFKDYWRRQLLNVGALKPTKEEEAAQQQAAENAEPTANEKLLEAAAANESAQAQLRQVDTIKTLAETEKIQAETEETRADTIRSLAGIEQKDREQAFRMAEAIAKKETAPPSIGARV
jgi:hypothetical protein